MRSHLLALLAVTAFAGSAVAAAASADDDALDARLGEIAHAWDHLEFEVADKDAKMAGFEQLASEADALMQSHPSAAEPMVWEAIILSSEAGVQRSLGALGKARRARNLLVDAAAIDPNALGDGSIYTSLGSLYYQVPGRPIGFGNRNRARENLEHALALNPDGLEPNYFMADFLAHQHDDAEALLYARKAQAAPPRPGREIADQGRRQEIAALIQEIQGRLQN